MSKAWRINSHTVVTGLTVAIGLGVATCLILSLMAHPTGLKARLEAVDQKLSQAEALAAQTHGPLTYPAGVVCHQSTGLASAALKQRLQAAASGGGVTLAKLDVAAKGGDQALSPVTFALEATGRYDAVVGLVAGLSKTQPELFIDQANLKSQTSQVSLTLNGRLYCSTFAPL